MSHAAMNKDRLVARVRRIAGQVQAIERALEAEAGCSEVLRQVASARGAIAGLMNEIVEEHIREHVADPALDEAARAAGADDLIALIRRYMK